MDEADAPIRELSTIYSDQDGNPTVLTERPGIQQYIWEHAVDLDRILHQAAETSATFSGKKFQICQPQVLILGQAVGMNGREPDTKWVNVIKEWPAPQNATEARQFIGLCGTIRIWIPNYSQIASSITSIWKKGVEFAWTEECQDAFDVLKDLITTAPALLPINYMCERPIIISVDSSYMGVGMILSQLD